MLGGNAADNIIRAHRPRLGPKKRNKRLPGHKLWPDHETTLTPSPDTDTRTRGHGRRNYSGQATDDDDTGCDSVATRKIVR